ncbi:MAG TPA: hypothetical protein ENK59_00300 [Thioploca sp.]|nr:hypothetical protein [Thioploca sp.]
MNEIIKNIFLGIILSLWNINLLAVDAGWINNFNGNSDSYTIKRGNETIVPTVFSILQVGDIISINNAQDSIEIYLNGKEQPVQINQQNSPFKITQATKVTELWLWMKQRFNDWQQFTNVPLISEISQDINMPLLNNTAEPVVLIAQDRDLYLQWQGGQPPYTVEIQKRFNPISSKNSPITAVKMDNIAFEANSSYRIQIHDSKGKTFIGGFKTVEINQAPIYKTIADSKLPIEIIKTLQAIWLAKQNNGEWIFEAYQQIAPFENYQPAKLLQNSLIRSQNTYIRRGIRG